MFTGTLMNLFHLTWSVVLSTQMAKYMP
jgi:hypothetical protein